MKRDVDAHFQPSGYDDRHAQRYIPARPDMRGSHYVNSSTRTGRQPAPQVGRRRGTGTLVAAIALIIIGVALIIVALAIWLPHERNYQAVHNVSAEAQQAVVQDSVTNEPIVDFAALQATYPEVVGWVQIPGTVVNYPVPQHEDNDFYLDHTLAGDYNPYGSVFMDYRSDPALADYNTVIYGHHLKNGEEFAQIAEYSDQAVFDELGTVFYVSQDGVVHSLTPIACMVVNGYDYDSIRTDFIDMNDFHAYVQATLDRSSAVASNVDVASVSHLFMLSTCSYERENDRTVLVLVEQGVSSGSSVGAATDQDVLDIQSAVDAAVAPEDPAEDARREGQG